MSILFVRALGVMAVSAAACLASLGGTVTAQQPVSPPAPAQDGGAFGLKGGQPLSSLRVVKKLEKNQYEVIVPKPHREFESYTAWLSPTVGLCGISGIGKTHENDRYGSAVRSSFDALKEALNEKYGQSNDFDYLNPGTLWDESQDWVMAVYQNERTLVSFWTANAGSDLPSSLAGVRLKVLALSSSEAWISLSYEFPTVKQCIREKDEKENEGL